MKFKKEKRPQKPDFKIGSNFIYNDLIATITKIDKENIYFCYGCSIIPSCMTRNLFEDLIREI